MYDFLPGFVLSPPRGLGFDEPLPQEVLDIEGKTRSNGFAWRGQFSPQLVESLLCAYCPEGACVLDPFSGSGTSLLEAARLGMPAYAFEINPAAWLLTRVYKLCNVTPDKREAALAAVSGRLLRLWESDLNERKPVFQDLTKQEDATGILAGAMIILSDISESEPTHTHCDEVFRKLARSVRSLPFSSQPLDALLGDARALPLSQASIDFIITSPPYINVFNYHQHYRGSAEFLGYDLLSTSRSEIGSNRANRGNRFLTVIQYCLDMASTLKELRRVCKADARVLIVVGHESNVLGVPFLNAELVILLAINARAFRLVLRQSRWYTNKFGLRIREDLLHFEPRGSLGVEWDGVARDAALGALTTGLSVVAGKNREALENAIKHVRITAGTPLLK